MRRLISTLLALSILISMSAPAFTTHGQKPDPGQQPDPAQDPFQPGHAIMHKLPKSARIGSTPERKAALNNLSPEDKEKVKQIFRDIVAKTSQNEELKKHQDDDLPTSLTISFKDKNGKRKLLTANRHKKGDNTLTSALKVKGQNRYLTLANTATPSNATILKANYSRSGIKRDHALRKAPALAVPQAGCSEGSEQFIRTFYQGALARTPYASELSYWMDTFAQAQSQGTLLSAAQNLGNTLFQSQEYANRGRSNRDFVFDCYRAFLQRDPDQGGWDFWTNQADSNGQPAVLQAFVVCDEFHNDVNAVCNVVTFDGDQDGLPDEFENQVADAFTPHYHISAGEQDQFVTFNDSPVSPETIKQRFGQTPVSHFRVHKEGFATDAYGNTVSVLRIDYLTLWDYDGGVVGGGACAWSLLGLDDVAQSLDGHYLDHERSAMLVAAPVSGGDYNLDPGAYSIYNIFTTGHEFTLTDQSMWFDYSSSPVPAYNHIELALSQSKHATYTFNPDYYPLLPWYIIAGTYDFIDWLYATDRIEWYWYLALQAIADDLFFSCAVEHFTDQGGQYAVVRTNVGELGTPINNSSFIAVPQIYKQFTTPYFH
jgi:hypothetical protein